MSTNKGGNPNISDATNKKQEKKKGFAPYLLMSGGQGSDETRAEALAMKEYAIEQGYSEELIITEEKSKNTLENMQFSKAVMEEKSHGENYKCAYASSSYHLMRQVFMPAKLV